MSEEYDLSKMKKRRGKVFKHLKVIKTIRLDADVLIWLEEQAEREGVGYQTYLNAFLKKFVGQKESLEDRVRKLEKKVFKKED